MIRMTLGEVATVVGGSVSPEHATAVLTAPASVDSRIVEPGGLFVAVPGEHVDGHDFVADAIANGAAGVLAGRPVDAACVVVPDVTVALAQLAHHVVKRIPALVIGIT